MDYEIIYEIIWTIKIDDKERSLDYIDIILK